MESPLPLLFKARTAGFVVALSLSVAALFLKYNRFIMAEMCFWVAGVWTLSTWRSSEYLKRGATEVAKLKKRADKENAKPRTRNEYATVRR